MATYSIFLFFYQSKNHASVSMNHKYLAYEPAVSFPCSPIISESELKVSSYQYCANRWMSSHYVITQMPVYKPNNTHSLTFFNSPNEINMVELNRDEQLL